MTLPFTSTRPTKSSTALQTASPTLRPSPTPPQSLPSAMQTLNPSKQSNYFTDITSNIDSNIVTGVGFIYVGNFRSGDNQHSSTVVQPNSGSHNFTNYCLRGRKQLQLPANKVSCQPIADSMASTGTAIHDGDKSPGSVLDEAQFLLARERLQPIMFDIPASNITPTLDKDRLGIYFEGFIMSLYTWKTIIVTVGTLVDIPVEKVKRDATVQPSECNR
eukprot:jgi/Psemu1/11868/gm1.11868_g